jgi:hypothetical protein
MKIFPFTALMVTLGSDEVGVGILSVAVGISISAVDVASGALRSSVAIGSISRGVGNAKGVSTLACEHA